MHYLSPLALAILLASASLIVESAEPSAPDSGARLAIGCTGCHGSSGQGFDSLPPIHRKQEAEFIRLMQEFRNQSRRVTVMNRIAKGYSDDDIAALARYFSHR